MSSDGDVDMGYEREAEDRIPSAPFANAGPAGVHVPFGSEYARWQGYQSQQEGYGQYSQDRHHQHYQQPQHAPHHHSQHSQQYQAAYGSPSAEGRDVYSPQGDYVGQGYAGYGHHHGIVRGGQPQY